jgi:MerR family copper efflux transcriptional regulator
MQTGLKIAEVARRSGFAPTTLRYYEEIGLVIPVERTPAGYRLYDERTVERLAFIARAKQLGCSLEEIADLVSAWDGGSCAPVQAHLRSLLESKIEDAQTQAAELLALTSQLQRARLGLDHNTPDGPCDDTCGCATDPTETVAVALTHGPSTASIACTLDGGEMPNRMAEWQAVLARVSDRTTVPGGVRLEFAPDVPLGEVARLAAAEHHCCRFFSFAITVDERGAALEVRAPDDALPIVEALFGAAAMPPG